MYRFWNSVICEVNRRLRFRIMFDKVEAFHRPGTIREALRLLHSGKGRARIVAGGTDVVVEADRSIRVLIDITKAGLNYIRERDGGCAIGATTSLAELEESRVIRKLAGGILARAAATCGSVQIRNMATIGGNLANASPAADLVTPLVALEAEVVLADARGRHAVPIAEFLSKHRPKESLIAEVAIPAPARGRWTTMKLGRLETDISLVNVAVGLGLTPRRRVKWARIALGAVAPAPFRAQAAESLLLGHELDEERLAAACEEAAQNARPIGDVRASAEYRRDMCRVLVRRALEECAAPVGCSL